MKLQFDPAVPVALALGGGGAKGGYQIGVWQALAEAGIPICAVSGTSVGALNGALVTMGDLEKARDIWRNIRFSQVMDVDDEAMKKLLQGDFWDIDLRSVATQFRDVLKNRGFDVTPLTNWIRQIVDGDTVRNAQRELFIVTYSLTDRKELELRARDLPDEELWDMLLASAYLPVFRSRKLGGKRYTDGGVADVVPVHVLVENGYRNIIAVSLNSIGVRRSVILPEDATVRELAPAEDLGSFLNFTPEQSRSNMTTGYLDARRLLYGLQGKRRYIDACWTEEEAYAFLRCQVAAVWQAQRGKAPTLRQLHEELLPALARKVGEARPGETLARLVGSSEAPADYRSLALVLLETAAEEAKLDRWQIVTERELADQVREASGTPRLAVVERALKEPDKNN